MVRRSAPHALEGQREPPNSVRAAPAVCEMVSERAGDCHLANRCSKEAFRMKPEPRLGGSQCIDGLSSCCVCGISLVRLGRAHRAPLEVAGRGERRLASAQQSRGWSSRICAGRLVGAECAWQAFVVQVQVAPSVGPGTGPRRACGQGREARSSLMVYGTESQRERTSRKQ